MSLVADCTCAVAEFTNPACPTHGKMTDEQFRSRACAECGHPLYFHRENGQTQRSSPGDPVPCFAALYDRSTTQIGELSGFCECRALIEAPA